MIDLLKTPLGHLRLITFAEGLSYLILLLIAMPLKYWAGYPSAVRSFGMIHGILFVVFIAYLAYCFFKYRWSIFKGVLILVASFIPFGNFYVDNKYLHPDFDKVSITGDEGVRG